MERIGTEKMDKQPNTRLSPGDVGETVIIPGDVSRAKIIADHFDTAEAVAQNGQFNTFTGQYKGVKVSTTSTGIGGAAAAITIEELIRVGAKNIIRLGTGGMMQTWLPKPGILVIIGAVTGDGTSVEYFCRGFPSIADFDIVEAMMASAKELGITVTPGLEWSHDSFYAGSNLSKLNILEIEKPWIDSGVLIASQEASTVFNVTRKRNRRGGTILCSAVAHQEPELIASDDEMKKAISDASRIVLETAIKLYKKDHPG